MRRATTGRIFRAKLSPDFYPRSPCGERRKSHKLTGRKLVFLSTLSLRRATNLLNRRLRAVQFLSTLSLRRATGGGHISEPRSKHFYPRSPCGERRQMPLTRSCPGTFLSTLSLRRATAVQIVIIVVDTLFLSTLSLRRATDTGKHFKVIQIFLSTLSLRRATPIFGKVNTGGSISIHALLAESDIHTCQYFFKNF